MSGHSGILSREGQLLGGNTLHKDENGSEKTNQAIYFFVAMHLCKDKIHVAEYPTVVKGNKE